MPGYTSVPGESDIQETATYVSRVSASIGTASTRWTVQVTLDGPADKADEAPLADSLPEEVRQVLRDWLGTR